MNKVDFFNNYGLFQSVKAKSIVGPHSDDGTLFFQTGTHVTEILISNDGMGPTGFYSRASVWRGDELIAECPVHNLEMVRYEDG